MVSNLYSAGVFYEKQKKGDIAKGYDNSKKLKKDSKGFYLVRNKSNGDSYKQRVSNNDKVYSRQEGVTKYSEAKDKDKKTQSLNESKSKHNAHAHLGDRKRGDGVYRV